MRHFIWILLLFSTSIQAQERYQYIIVPKKFSFFDKDNKYNLNALTKSFFESEGFTVLYNSDTLPQDLATNRCLALFADALESNTMFITNVKVEIKDCTNKIVYESTIGSSRDKSLERGYTVALRAALTSMKGKLNIRNNSAHQKQIEEKPIKKNVTPTQVAIKEDVSANQLYVIPTDTGFKLVDSQPKTVMLIYKTSVKNVFIAEKENKKGTLIQTEKGWYFEYVFNSKVYSEKVDVVF